MFEVFLIALGVVVSLGLTFTLALFWAMHDLGIKDWDLGASFRSLMDEKPEKPKAKSASSNTDIRC
tara:strand:- start:113 stop:310 length:198 start_codon:yes stop_codon:yes gene_type:complete